MRGRQGRSAPPDLVFSPKGKKLCNWYLSRVERGRDESFYFWIVNMIVSVVGGEGAPNLIRRIKFGGGVFSNDEKIVAQGG